MRKVRTVVPIGTGIKSEVAHAGVSEGILMVLRVSTKFWLLPMPAIVILGSPIARSSGSVVAPFTCAIFSTADAGIHDTTVA